MKYVIFCMFLFGCQLQPYVSPRDSIANKAISGEVNVKNINDSSLCTAINRTKGRSDLVDEFYFRKMDKNIRLSIIKNADFPIIGMNIHELLCISQLNIFKQSMSMYEARHYVHLVVSVGDLYFADKFRIMLENGIIKNISN